ncbi:hypothetical protein Ddc_02143 [Ditylenchus destructor]|nr:hypothetical protein Ddc_02143 [Ditylenchus destructor]
MLPVYVLLDILRCMNRHELHKIQETSRAINSIVKSEFASKPLRLLGKGYWMIFHIENGTLLLSLRGPGQWFDVSSKGWQKYRENIQPKYPLDEIRPFLPNWLRFKYTQIKPDLWYTNSGPYSLDHILAMESIAHIWRGQMLAIYLSDSDANSLSLMLSSSNLLQCSNLIMCESEYGRNYGLKALEHSAIYNLRAVLLRRSMIADDIMCVTQRKSAYPQSDTVFVFYQERHELINAVDKICKEFLKSPNPCRLKMIICTETEFGDWLYTPGNVVLRTKNRRTAEVLELKRISNADVINKFDINLVEIYEGIRDPFLLSLERYNV